MASLRDQLQQAKLLSKKDARRLAHEERVHRKAVGGAGAVDQEQAAHQAELQRQQQAQREADRVQQARLRALQEANLERAACLDLLRRQARCAGRRGATRYHFRLADGRLPGIDLPVDERMQLQAGELCIVRLSPGTSHDYGLLAIGHGRRVAASIDGRVVWAVPGALD